MSRLADLLAHWEAGDLSPAEVAELKQLLAAPAARAELADDWLLTETIYDTLHTRGALAPAGAPQPEANRSPHPVAQSGGQRAEDRTSSASPRPAATAPRAPRSRRFPWLVWREVHLSLGRVFAAGTAAALALAGVWLYFQKATVATLGETPAGVAIERQGQVLPGTAGQALYVGDVLRVAPTGAATVAWAGETTAVRLAADTRLALANPLFGKRMTLQTGALEATVAPQSPLRPMTISTPQAEARVVGTHFSLAATNRATRLEVMEGAIRFRKTHPATHERRREVMVSAGHVSTAAPAQALGLDWLTGFLSTDAWSAPMGTTLSDAPALGTPLAPPGVAAAGSQVVERLRGYLLAPASGDFLFWVASHRGSTPVELWLSPNEDPAQKRRIAFETPARGGASPGNASLQLDFHRSPTQQSAPQTLEQGRRYYLEVWHTGTDLQTLGFGWRLPGQPDTAQPERVDLHALCPFVETVAGATGK